jgi:eukaryotic-like serine/threonine-protein kinase
MTSDGREKRPGREAGAQAAARARTEPYTTTPRPTPSPVRQTMVRVSAGSGPVPVRDIIVGLPANLPSDLAIGEKVGDYEIEGKIAEGGMGAVYAAVHGLIGKHVAIKVIRSELCASNVARERFVQEARVVNQIDHPNIVDIFAIGALDDGRPYLVMELLRGETLAQRMEESRLSVAESIEVLLQVCAALEAAHAHGVVHRDLKPDNIFLAHEDGAVVVKLLDWGIAKLVDSQLSGTGSGPSLTHTGMMIGTPEYIAPEQARGKQVDYRADIYSLGAIAYELFCEDVPFSGESVADVVAMHLHQEPTRPSELWTDIPPVLDALLVAMLAKEAAARPALAEVTSVLSKIGHELSTRVGAAGKKRLRPRTRLAVGSAPPPVRMSEILAMQDRATIDDVSLADAASQAPALRPLATIDEPVAVEPRFPWRIVKVAVVATVLLGGGAAVYWLEPESPVRVSDNAVAGNQPERWPALSGAVPATPATATPAAVVTEPVAALAAVPATTSALIVSVAAPEAQVLVDGERVTVVGGEARIELPPGAHDVSVTAAGYTALHRSIEVADATVMLDAALSPLPAAAAPARSSSGSSGSSSSSRRRSGRGSGFNPDGTINPFGSH